MVQHPRAEGRRDRSAHHLAGRIGYTGAGDVPRVARVSTGASLYFTVVAGQRGDPIEQWLAAKKAASDAIMATGGTITHHHAVGSDHRPWMRAEVGDLGVTLLRTIKATLDPAGILNPGKLIP